MYRRRSQYHPHPGTTRIDLRYHLGLLVGTASDDENQHILRLVAGVAATLEEWVL